MSEIESQDLRAVISLRKSIAIYLCCLVGMCLLIAFSMEESWFPGIIAVLAYFVFGFILNRVVLRNLVEWHPVYNTLANVSSAKIWSLLLWPLTYLSLFTKLAINKLL